MKVLEANAPRSQSDPGPATPIAAAPEPEDDAE